MSSTRVKERKGKHLDFYETPDKVVAGLAASSNFFDGAQSLLEPSAGRGSIVRAVQSRFHHVKVGAVEIQDFAADLAKLGCDFIIADFLTLPVVQYDRIVANPPFSQAEEFVVRCREFLLPAGKMAFLLRLPFIASVKRYKLFSDFRPSEIHVLSQRPKFGGTNIDSCDYAWIVWNKESSHSTSLNWIPPE